MQVEAQILPAIRPKYPALDLQKDFFFRGLERPRILNPASSAGEPLSISAFMTRTPTFA